MLLNQTMESAVNAMNYRKVASYSSYVAAYARRQEESKRHGGNLKGRIEENNYGATSNKFMVDPLLIQSANNFPK